MPSVISGDANVSATEFGYLDGVTSALQTQIDSKLPLAGGKILQIVRATDSTARTTTSTSLVDVTGMAVTITPQKSDSAILIIATFNASTNFDTGSDRRAEFVITDSSNNAITGANNVQFGMIGNTNAANSFLRAYQTLLAYATPATTSAVTYKLRFRRIGDPVTVALINNEMTGTMYAIEVSA